jgi:hypothetical protein
MLAPPDPNVRSPATLQSDGAHSQPTLKSTTDPTETVSQFQAASLRRRFAIGYCVAAALAPLVWGLPR